MEPKPKKKKKTVSWVSVMYKFARLERTVSIRCIPWWLFHVQQHLVSQRDMQNITEEKAKKRLKDLREIPSDEVKIASYPRYLFIFVSKIFCAAS